MKKFKYIEHTAEAGFQAFGKTMEQAFSNAVLAMSNMLTDVSKIALNRFEKIKLSAQTKENLLVDFLTEILFLMEVKGFIPAKASKIKIVQSAKKCALESKLCGDDIKNCKTHGDIKAITYHELKVEKRGGNWMVQVVVDV